MINSQFSIDYLTRNSGAEKRESISSDGDIARTPSPSNGSELSDPESCTSNDNAESIAQVLLSLDRSIKNGLCSSDPNEKPPHSYIAMISMAVLSKPDKKILLNDIYQYIMDNFPYYNNKEKAWRNSIRHNLSLNECFVKSGRSDNGKGNYWSIHPACIEDFAKGDFRRRQARRRARKSSVKSFGGSSENNSRFNLGYVPMTPSQVGFHPFSINSHTIQMAQSNPYQLLQPAGTSIPARKQLPPTLPQYGNEHSFSNATIPRFSFNAPPAFCSSPAFASGNLSPPAYSSCQLQKAFPQW